LVIGWAHPDAVFEIMDSCDCIRVDIDDVQIANQSGFNAETCIHFPGLKGLDASGVYIPEDHGLLGLWLH
jgi:hypothetical protein